MNATRNLETLRTLVLLLAGGCAGLSIGHPHSNPLLAAQVALCAVHVAIRLYERRINP